MAETQQMVSLIMELLTDTSLDEAFVEMVLKRLESFNYAVKESDAFAIAFAITKGENHYKNQCNISEIPDGLKENLCDVCCGEFFKGYYAAGKLDIPTIAKGISSVKLGDTQLSFDTSKGGADFESLLDDLISGKEGDLACYRTIRW